MIKLTYEKDFSERNIPTKAWVIQMNQELINYCEKQINDLLKQGIIRKNQSIWSYSTFCVNKSAKIEWRTLRLVINHNPLNQALRWIKYPIPNKKDLLTHMYSAKVFLKFDMKLRF